MIAPFEPHHLLELELQPGQRVDAATVNHAETLAQSLVSGSVFHAGKLAACGGVFELWRGRAMAWAALSADAGPALVEITRHVLRGLNASPFRRVELYARLDFAPSMRWAKLLGFQFESIMRAGAPDGADLAVYARVRKRAVDVLGV
jgi:hypothetical protein